MRQRATYLKSLTSPSGKARRHHGRINLITGAASTAVDEGWGVCRDRKQSIETLVLYYQRVTAAVTVVMTMTTVMLIVITIIVVIIMTFTAAPMLMVT